MTDWKDFKIKHTPKLVRCEKCGTTMPEKLKARHNKKCKKDAKM